MKNGAPGSADCDPILAAIERERRRIGSALHEHLCQTLAGISLQLDVMSRWLKHGKDLKSADLLELCGHVNEAIAEVRVVGNDLRPNLQGAGLIEWLHQLAEATNREVRCEYVCEKPVSLKNRAAALALVRIAEEAVSNAVKHACAKKITVTLDRTARTVTLSVSDDGKGFEPSPDETEINGINLMRRHARAAKGKLMIDSNRGAGTVVSCKISRSH